MTLHWRRWVWAAACAIASGGGFAQTFPSKPIRIVIGTPAGGGSELMGRLIGQHMTQAWGQPVVIDPRPGASGNIAAELVAKAAPDGHTLYVCYGTHTVNPILYKRVPYDPIKDFAPVTLIAKQFNALAVHPSIPARSVKELVALARSRPGKMTYASSGNGSPNHLGMELFKQTAKIDIAHIPYKGIAPARTDLFGGHVDTIFDTLRSVLPYHEAGRIRVLAVASAKRSAIAPDLPTVDESGWRGIEVLTWHALLAPAGTPPEIVGRLQAEIRRGLTAPAQQEKLAKDGVEVVAGTPGELDAFLRADIAKWQKVIQAAHIQLD
jgi:tripartite-type tricarboxylate transporter receptor subunit TctC